MQTCPKCGKPLDTEGTRHATGARRDLEPLPTGTAVIRCSDGHDWMTSPEGELIYVP